MTLQITFIEKPEYLLVEVSGEWGTQDGVEALLSMSERAKERGLTRILVDRRNHSNPKTEYARFEAGVTLAKVFPYPFRFAVVDPQDETNNFGETAAVNRGATAASFSDMGEAKKWLLEDPSA